MWLFFAQSLPYANHGMDWIKDRCPTQKKNGISGKGCQLVMDALPVVESSQVQTREGH